MHGHKVVKTHCYVGKAFFGGILANIYFFDEELSCSCFMSKTHHGALKGGGKFP